MGVFGPLNGKIRESARTKVVELVEISHLTPRSPGFVVGEISWKNLTSREISLEIEDGTKNRNDRFPEVFFSFSKFSEEIMGNEYASVVQR